MNFFATTPKGLELLLVEELRQLGATDAAEKLAGVVFSGDIELAYKACLWSRLANRILLSLVELPVITPEDLYAAVQTIAWDEHIHPEGTLHINFSTSQSDITHTLFGAQKVKDAIVDQLREKYGTRPNVSRDTPDHVIYVYLYRNKATIGLDLSGESLHRRGYRLEQGLAPLKENLAAAILLRANWKTQDNPYAMLVDPMCGSGTLLIEAALIAGDIAPGLGRDYYGFLRWKKHVPHVWDRLLDDAQQRKNIGIEKIPQLVGYDADATAIKIAFANIERSGFLGKIHVEKRDISAVAPKKDITNGLVVVNPPYGERLGETSELKILYRQLGAQLKQEFVGWQAAVFTANPELGKTMGIRARRHYALFNGAIPCQLLLFDLHPEWFIDSSPAANNERRIRKALRMMTEEEREAVQMFSNRLHKKYKHLLRWAKRENITCYRVYDADIPQYALSIDIFDDCVLVREKSFGKNVDRENAQKRVQNALAVIADVIPVPATHIFFLNSYESPTADFPGFNKKLHHPS